MSMPLMKSEVGLQLLAICGLLFFLCCTRTFPCKNNSCWRHALCEVPKSPIMFQPGKNVTGYKNAPLVQRVFDTLGYDIIFHDVNDETKVDVLWSYYYPFGEELYKTVVDVSRRCPDIKINHFPGIDRIAVKSMFNTLTESPYIPKTFSMSEDKNKFLQHIQKNNNSQTLWIEKRKSHRGNQVKQIQDLNLDGQVLVQRFIHNQFLLHGHVINIGIHVLITSAVPLRAYILDSAWLTRICSRPYDPNNFNNRDTYVTDGDHNSNISIYEFPPMKRYFAELNYSRKKAIIAYATELGFVRRHNIERQIKDAIQGALLANQLTLLSWTTSKKQRSNSNWQGMFFESMRWDFILDDELNVHRIEANMSPDLIGYGSRYTQIKNEHLMFSVIKTLGGGKTQSIHDSDVGVETSICYSSDCHNCIKQQCQLCLQCLSDEHRQMLKTSYTEHVNRQGLRRVNPPPMTQSEARSYNVWMDRHLPKSEQINRAWFRAKCIQDIAWCT